MRGFSKAIIAGNLTRDPELRTTPNGATVCSFSVAINRTYRDVNGGQREEVSYIDCTAWSKQGETIHQYLKKGSGILLSGRLYQHSWDDKTTGQKRSRVEIVVEDCNFIGGPRDGSEPGGGFGGSFGGGSSFGSPSGPSSSSSSSAPASPSASPASAPAIPDDIPDHIDLSEVPF